MRENMQHALLGSGKASIILVLKVDRDTETTTVMTENYR